MSNLVLKQYEGFRRREFELGDKALKLRTKIDGDIKEWSINLEDLGDKLNYQTYSNIGPRIIAGFFIAILVITTVLVILGEIDYTTREGIVTLILGYLTFGILSYVAIFGAIKKEVHLVGGNEDVSFFHNSPSQEEVDDFIQEVINRSHQILIKKYGTIDPDLPEEIQMNQLDWLKNRELISGEAYELMKEEYKRLKLLNS